MPRLHLILSSVLLTVCSVLPLAAQQNITPATASAAVPNVTRFSGTLTDLNGKALTNITGVTFSLYKDEQGGAPLWVETQNITPDKNGHYSVVLGSTTATGLPSDVFASGEARWLGVRAEGQKENPRVLLVSVPYALKAADAETLGGLPASAFLQAASGNGSGVLHPTNATVATTTTTPTGSGTTGFVPLWTSATQLGSSRLFQLNAAVGIGTIKPAFALDVNGKINSAIGFYLGALPFAFGSSVSQNTFFGFSGNSTTTGTQNTGLGALALELNTSGNAGTAVGAGALESNTTGYWNTALGVNALASNTTGEGNTAVGMGAAVSNLTGSYNTSIGYTSGNVSAKSSGSQNTFIGADSGPDNTANLTNATAIGYNAQVGVSNAMVLGQPGTMVGIGTSIPSTPLTIQADDNGQGRGGVPHQLQIQGATSPNKQLLIGYLADTLTDAGFGSIQATDSGVKNTWLALQPGGGQVAIQEEVPLTGAPLEIRQSAGNAVADGWATYSSRRWKTNIETLHGSLGKIEKMRGVSYELKATGKHEIGVIAEEVGAVVPEVVQWEPNGKDAQSVDYSRMVALLIEGMKEQQALIHKQQSQIRAQQKQIAVQRAQMIQVMSHVQSIESSLILTRQAVTLEKAGQQITAEVHAVSSSR